jgi:hypothetical protein
MNILADRLMRIEDSINKFIFASTEVGDLENIKQTVKETIEDAFCSDDEYNSVNRIHDKLNLLIEDSKRCDSIVLAQRTLDKFEDYMKNVDKLNLMINEFKGCVAMARAAIGKGEVLAQEVEGLKNLAEISLKIYQSMHSFIKTAENMNHEPFFKIDQIYKIICCKKEKQKKPRKSTKTK